MKSKSHNQLGHYLLDHIFSDLKSSRRSAFVIGCMEPDWNPATYLKGFFRAQKLRGHNFENAERGMKRLAKKLIKRKHAGLRDYYRAGKLVHYLTDAFTYAHNRTFAGNLRAHVRYESELQNRFSAYLKEQNGPQADRIEGGFYSWLTQAHQRYLSLPANMEKDMHFAVSAASSAILWFSRMLQEPGKQQCVEGAL